MTRHFEPSEPDLRFSGPEFWPKLCADDAVDRFIFRRPELAYLGARRRQRMKRAEEGLPRSEPQSVRISIDRIDRIDVGEEKPYRSPQRLYTWRHAVLERPDEDVRVFLQELHGALGRRMPNRPMLDTSVKLIFYRGCYNRKSQLLAWTQPWL